MVVAAFAIAGCGGSSDGPRDVAPSATQTVSLADTCPKVQDALDAAFAGEALAVEADYQRFTDDVAALIAVVDPKGEPLLQNLVDASKDSLNARKVGLNQTDVADLDRDWRNTVNRVADTCQQLGAPLS